jgi:DNA-binding transcriptional regulator YiaG
MTEAALFHRCRKALGLSQPAIARALLIASDRTVRRWE